MASYKVEETARNIVMGVFCGQKELHLGQTNHLRNATDSSDHTNISGMRRESRQNPQSLACIPLRSSTRLPSPEGPDPLPQPRPLGGSSKWNPQSGSLSQCGEISGLEAIWLLDSPRGLGSLRLLGLYPRVRRALSGISLGI